MSPHYGACGATDKWYWAGFITLTISCCCCCWFATPEFRADDCCRIYCVEWSASYLANSSPYIGICEAKKPFDDVENMLFVALALPNFTPSPVPFEFMLCWGAPVNIKLLILLVFEDDNAKPNDDEKEEEEEEGISTLCLAW